MSKRKTYELSRRNLIGGAAATAAAVGIGSGVASAAPSARESVLRDAGFQDSENVILIGTLGEAQTINPFLSNDTESYWRCKLMYEQFLRIDPATFAPTAGPGLVAEYSLEELTYTFRIHDNATYSDGTDVTAEDVAFTLHGLMAPTTASPNATYFLSIVGAEEYVAGSATRFPASAWSTTKR